MSTISNERLEKLSEYDCADRYEVMSMATELLALRKEREKEESAVCPKCGNTGLADSGGVQPWGEPILIECDCTAPPAPGADDDSLPYDPQIAEYEQMMEAELKAAADMEHKPKSEMSQKAEQLLRDTTELAATLSAETDTTAQQFESLAGKSVVPAGWKLVPIEPTDAMCDIGHIGVDVLTGVTDDNEYYSIDGPYAAKVYRAMIAAAPEPCK
ncbi:hypothetical protein QMW84_16665 [Cronobacter sakazakii]|nr:hypothetical protein [Cronobacter sakazakii]MDI7565149.1 hypothetical protein [Cronobacter sakazakii]MDI7567381.1 hypothetical protein [Cronobacter sakazakii]MDI7572366.1 hypothetical protein [Cronobacter sakazakii]MDI7577306.1 hypothetical protein [Cronobacter sakazakii]